MFIRNEWYGAAWSEDIGRRLTATTVAGERIVLFRTESGMPVAFFDRCPHRSAPLSAGKLKGDAIECGYHGLTFDCSGACIRVPAQSRIPEAARLRRFPVTERYGIVWVWPGDPALADASRIVEMPYFGAPGWSMVKGHMRFGCNYMTFIENLIDPAHPTFVHGGSIGHPAAADVPITSEQDGDTVVAGRWLSDCPPVPMQQQYGRFQGNVDRWQYYYLKAPSVSRTDMGCLEVGAPRTEALKEASRYRALSYCAVTPVDERTTDYFWLEVVNFVMDDVVARDVIDTMERTFEEDRALLEEIQRIEDRYGRADTVAISSDSGVMRLRRIVARRLEDERARAGGVEAGAIAAGA